MQSEQILSEFVDGTTKITGLTPTVVIRRTDNVVVVSGDTMSEIGDGRYQYVFSGYVQGTTYLIDIDGGDSCPESCRLQNGTNFFDAQSSVVKESYGKVPLAPLIQGQNGQKISIDLDNAVRKITKEINAIPKVDLKDIKEEIKTGMGNISKEVSNVSKKVDSIDVSSLDKKFDGFSMSVSEMVAWKEKFHTEMVESFNNYAKAIKESIENISFSTEFSNIIDIITSVRDEIITEAQIDRTDYEKVDMTKHIEKIHNSVSNINAGHNIMNSIDRLENTISSMKINAKQNGGVDVDLIQSVVMKGINMVIDCIVDSSYDKEQQKQIMEKLDNIKNNMVK